MESRVTDRRVGHCLTHVETKKCSVSESGTVGYSWSWSINGLVGGIVGREALVVMDRTERGRESVLLEADDGVSVIRGRVGDA